MHTDPQRTTGTADDETVPRPRVFPAEYFLKRLAEQLRELGLSVSFRDPAGAMLTAPSFQGQYCCTMCGQKGYCLEAMGLLAQKASRRASGHCEILTSPSGCCMFAVPIYQRRRLLGAAVACFPTLQMLESEGFARACSRAHLDAEAMAELCRREAVYTDQQVKSMCNILELLIKNEQAKEVAKEELATLSANLANTYEELSLLYTISGSMKVTRGTTKFFDGLCGELLEVMRIGAAAVVLHPRLPSADSKVGGQAREKKAEPGPGPGGETGRGDLFSKSPTDCETDQVVSAGELPLTAEQLVQISRRYIAPRTGPKAERRAGSTRRGGSAFPGMIDNRFSEHSGHLGSEVGKIRTLIAAPLIVSGRYKGAVVGFNKIDGEFDSVDLKLVSSISGQAAVFLGNHHLYEDLQDLLMGMLHALTASIDAKDPYTCGHSRRVALVSRKLAQLSGFDEDRVGRIYLAGLLHDIGKIGIPELVLRKTGGLTVSEYESMQRHPEIGATILSSIRQMEDILPVILHHHERPDGGGYPHGLSGHEIPIEALIVGLADGFDAMTSCRTYRGAMPLAVAVAEIRRCSGTQFDPAVAELLLSLDLKDFLAEIRTDGVSDLKVFGDSSAFGLPQGFSSPPEAGEQLAVEERQ